MQKTATLERIISIILAITLTFTGVFNGFGSVMAKGFDDISENIEQQNDSAQNNDQAYMALNESDTELDEEDDEEEATQGGSRSPSSGDEFGDLIQAPYTYQTLEREKIRLNTGGLLYESEDYVLPGPNGMDIRIVSRYDSEKAALEKYLVYSTIQ